MSRRIVLTGGGTAGHVTPNIALMPQLRANDFELFYIGSYDGIEKKLIEALQIPYYGISSGKLRRYFDWKNFSDPFRVVKGFHEAIRLLKEIRPDIVFSKGGFVSVPVVQAAHRLHIPVIIHESDMTPGLANRLAIPAATKVCCNFPETLSHLPAEKAVLTGSPIRAELHAGDAARAKAFCGFSDDRPVLLIMGGSQGSVAVNKAIRAILPELLQTFSVIHLCGKGHLDDSLAGLSGYAQFEYISDELADLFALSDMVISRAGANAICELLDLRKPMVLIPLPLSASRGDQILNAKSFEKQGYCAVLDEDTMTQEQLRDTIFTVYQNRDVYRKAMESGKTSNAVETIVSLILELTKGKSQR